MGTLAYAFLASLPGMVKALSEVKVKPFLKQLAHCTEPVSVYKPSILVPAVRPLFSSNVNVSEIVIASDTQDKLNTTKLTSINTRLVFILLSFVK
jgi:hypothetical protein